MGGGFDDGDAVTMISFTTVEPCRLAERLVILGLYVSRLARIG